VWRQEKRQLQLKIGIETRKGNLPYSNNAYHILPFGVAWQGGRQMVYCPLLNLSNRLPVGDAGATVE
jgi:hypothetical protein